MAEEGTISSLIGRLFGGSGPKTVPASQPTHYPTAEDAAFARKNDYSYGQPWAPEFEGRSARVLTGDPNTSPLPATTVGGERLPEMSAGTPLADYYARGALASQNSALATLGFNPSRTATDLHRDPENVNILGLYRPAHDEIYANAGSPSTLIHESIHRGIEKLRGSPFWHPDFEEITAGGNNEMTTRHLMQSRMGDPEAAISGDKGQNQQHQARFMYEKSLASDRYNKLLDRMEQAAANYVAAKRPGGPR